ncbi:MAG: polysaccharide biosynthesis C-terminal domain-containing protein [Lachnospiraceae bacterium]|nr:polysaccharide biosynthesis C-terminal domain-containing protein [Lachnospiraceae bacterium]
MKLRKRERSQSGLINRTIKNPLVQYAGILSYAILLVMRIPLLKVIKDAGMGMFAPAFELFLLITLFTSYSMTGAVSSIIRYRVKREQYRNARSAFKAAFLIDLLISIASAVLLVLLSSFIADILVLESLSRTAVMAAAPVIILAAFIGTFRGYFNGFGLGVLTAHSQYIESISMMICSVIGGNMLYTYGIKVSALKQNVAYSYAYGALGAMLGVMASQIITLMHLLVIYVVYSGTLRGKLGMDGSKRMETQYSLQRMVLGNSIPIAIVAILSNLFMLIDQRMFNYCMNKKELGEIRTASWGSYYGKFAVLVGICTVFTILSIYTMTGKISTAYDREEYRVMRDRLGKAVRRLSITAFPVAIYLAALANAVVTCLYEGENDTVISWVQKGAVIIVLYSFCFLFGQLLYKMRMIRELLFATLISLLVHVLSAYILVQKALMGADGIVYALIVFFALYGGLNFFFISRNLKYRQDWIGGVAFPAVAAGVSGVVVMIVSSLLLEPLGGALTMLAGILVGLFLYITFLMILKVIGEAELSKMPLGFFFIMLGKNIGVLR